MRQPNDYPHADVERQERTRSSDSHVWFIAFCILSGFAAGVLIWGGCFQ